MITLNVNGKRHELDVEEDAPLLAGSSVTSLA